MRPLTGLGLTAFLVVASATAASAEPKPLAAPPVLAEKDRLVAGGRAVELILPQKSIGTSIDIGRVADDDSGGGGLLGSLIIGAMDDKRERMSENAQARADATVAPLREALADFDVDALALATTEAALRTPEWFAAQTIATSREASPAGRLAFVTATDAPQFAFVTYNYGLSPDFTQIRVNAEIALARRVTGKGGKSDTAAPAHYRQTISSIVELPKRSYDHGANVAQWSAEGGKLAETSLAAAFAEIERLIPYALALSAAELKGFEAKNREKAFAAGTYGPLVSRDDDGRGGLLIWHKGLVHIEPAP
ncbi:hypothetical protein BWQ93_01760 [Sphingopyxis sp. QXT-31]|uniref:hypothetical protein n=1 Tax=Sphingopyxis sp. QXT-31 TaxID=1357916 RepID=UPI00097931A9|nr:hypothetical protein [Sphingopyxis sp. QXT-31]APZ97357.1 hypothetical protein BWQ93_01760 [Sphingopyxis sp. QXT-31]